MKIEGNEEKAGHDPAVKADAEGYPGGEPQNTAGNNTI